MLSPKRTIISLFLGLVVSILQCTIATANGNSSRDGFDLKILHINDHHSHLLPDTGTNLDLGGESTRVELGGFARVVTKFNELSRNYDGSLLKLHAGDAITGTLFYTLFKGEADAALMNQVCFDAFALGNHEFDDGDSGLVDFLNFLDDGTCDTSILGANVVPEVGVSPLAPTSSRDFIEPVTVVQYENPRWRRGINRNRGGGKSRRRVSRFERVGIVGLVIANKTKFASNPDETTEFLDEVETAQRWVNRLRRQGINKIVLLTHYQYENDLKLAAMVRGVDVIVGGDSHSLLGDFDNIGLNAEGPYPTVVYSGGRGKKGSKSGRDRVCVVQAWQYSNVVGELNVSFDRNGRVQNCAGTPHLLLGDSFKRRPADGGDRVEIEGEARDKVLADIEANAQLGIVAPDPTAVTSLSGYEDQVNVLQQQVAGLVGEDLCYERIPGQGRSTICSETDTLPNGGDVPGIVAKAQKFVTRSDIAIQNAGGVRTDLPAGQLTLGAIYELLPFSNTLVQLQMTGSEIKMALEDGLDFALQEDGSTGAYPYASGLRWAVDVTQPKGSRFSNLEVSVNDGDPWTPIDNTSTYDVVTNSFAASGGDGYSTFETVSDDGRSVDTFIEYAQSFVDYVESVGTLNKLPLDEYSTQSFSD